MSVVLLLHGRLAVALMLYLLVLGAWALVLWRRGAGASPAYRGALVVAEVVALAQGIFGVALWPPRDWVHVLYGLSIAVTLPFAYTYARERTGGAQSLVYGVASLFAFGLALRGIFTG